MEKVEQDAKSSMATEKLGEISILAKALIAAELEVALAELELKKRKARVQAISTEDLPGLMSELGLTEVTLEDGSKVEVKDMVAGAITIEKQEEALKWLEDHKFGGLIKTEIDISFGKGELEKAIELAERLRGEGFELDVARGVHSMTLGAFLREQIAAGGMVTLEDGTEEPVPLALFGCNPFKQAKLIKPKASKAKKTK